MDAWNTAGSGPGSAADREAVRTAEQNVSDAWIGRLLLAESETEAAVGACARVRERAAGQVRAAQRNRDLAGLVRSQAALENADAAWGRALETHECARGRLVRELAAWSEATARRLRQARADADGTDAGGL